MLDARATLSPANAQTLVPELDALLPRATEALRQVVDLEHWGAFQSGFVEVFELVMSVARGERGRPPGTITFLSGDVHHSYVAEVTGGDAHGARSSIVQAVCSPISEDEQFE